MYRKGFTLVELVVVIAILAIIAFVSVPRFIALQDDAHQEVVLAAQSQFHQGIQFAHKAWLIQGGGSSEMNDLPGYGEDSDGNPQLDMNDVGYPLGTNKNSPMKNPYNIGQDEDGCRDIWEAIMITDLTVTVDSDEADQYDLYTQRYRYRFETASGSRVRAYAACYYIYTKQGYNSDYTQAEYVFWYNSRTGDVSSQQPD